MASIIIDKAKDEMRCELDGTIEQLSKEIEELKRRLDLVTSCECKKKPLPLPEE